MFSNDPKRRAWITYAQETAQAQAKNGGNFKDIFRSILGNRDMRAQFDTEYGKAPAGSTTKTLAEMMAEQEAKRTAQMKEQGLNPDGSPIAPEFQGIAGADGRLDEKYKLGGWQNVNANQDAMNAYKATAMREAGSDSPWAKVMLEKQGIEQAQNMDIAAQGANNNMIQAFTRLAQTGGLGGGDRARMAMQAGQNGFIQRQQVARQGQLDQSNIRLQDESNRMNQLKDVQGMSNQQADIQFRNQQQAANIDQYNNDNLIKNVAAKNLFDTNTYNQQMQKWAAGKTADAQRSAAGGGGKK